MLAELAQADADERWRYYEQLAGMHRTIPTAHGPVPGSEVEVEIESDAGYRHHTEEH